jgi:chemotaxis protein histidine kinase CheA
MQKVYLLLRSNQQTGPYSLEELVQFDLKPFDLIWIEGKSAGWYYPQEIKALHPYLSFVHQAATPPLVNPIQSSAVKPDEYTEPKKVFVSMPSNVTKEEPAPKPSFTPVTASQSETPKFSEPVPHKAPEEVKTVYAKSLQEVETDYMNWMYQKKTKKKTTLSAKGAIAACLLVSVAFAGWMILKPAADSPVKTPPEQTAFLPEQDELPAESATDDEPLRDSGKEPNNKKQKQGKVVVLTDQKAKKVKEDVKEKSQEETALSTSPQHNANEAVTETKEESPAAAEAKDSERITTEAPKEKKKLRDKIADLFKKKPEEKKEEARPVEEEGGERRSVRREAGSNLAQMVMVKFTVPNDWMMGIKGAKAALTNRSSETLVKAVVEVVYYNDDNDVLDKRTISFANIKSKQTQTVSIPDHQTATRLEYNVVSAIGANEPFAKR